MNWKEFLKPDNKKIILFLVIVFIFNSLSYLLFSYLKSLVAEFPTNIKVDYTLYLGLPLPYICEGFCLRPPVPYFVNFFIDIIFYYVLAASVVRIYEKVKKK